MKGWGLRSLSSIFALLLLHSSVSHAAFWDFLIHPNLVNVVTFDPFLGNADDQVFPADGLFPGVNNNGAASQFSFTNGNYGFLEGQMEVRSNTLFGLSPKLAFGLNEHNFVDMSGHWNNNSFGLFNQPFNQSLNTSSPSIININPDQTYTTSFVLDDSASGSRLQITGSGQYLLNSQNASDLYAGDVLTHFDTVVPLLPGGWQTVSQETQTVEVLDGAFAGLTGVATVTFYSFDFGSAPANPPSALGPPWLTTGFTASVEGDAVIGGEPFPFNVIGGDGTASLSSGDTASARNLAVGLGNNGNGAATITGPGSKFTADYRANLQSGTIHVTNGGKLYVDNATGTNPIASSVDSSAPNALIVVDGAGSEIKVSGGTNQSILSQPEGVGVTNYVASYNGGRIEVKNGGKITVEGINSSLILVGGFGLSAVPTSSSLLVEGENSLIDGGSLITVGQHPDVLVEFPFLQSDSGLLEVRDSGKAKAELIYIGANGTVTGNGGTIEGIVENHGTIAPGESPGILNIVGDYSQGPDGKLLIEIAGTNPGEFDVLNISGTASIAGALEIVLLDGFTPDETDTFDFLNPGALVGSFDDFIFPIFGNNQTFALESGPNGFSVSVAPVPLPAAIWLLGTAFAGLILQRRRKI